MAFAKGNDVYAKKLYGGPVLTDTDPYRTLLLKEKIGIENWNRDFHNYTLIWKPGLYIIKTVLTQLHPSKTFQATQFDITFDITINSLRT